MNIFSSKQAAGREKERKRERKKERERERERERDPSYPMSTLFTYGVRGPRGSDKIRGPAFSGTLT